MTQLKQSVGIVIPVFNRPEQLEAAIRSVLEQSHSLIHLTVVDDASEVDLSVCRSLIERHGHQWLRMPENSGPAAARNFGVEKTEGDWVTFLDSDDQWLPKKLETQIQWHDENPDFRISQVKEIWIRNDQPILKPARLGQPEGEIFKHCVERCAVGPSCVAMRRDLWEESGGFDPFFRACEDYELWLRICRRERVGLVTGKDGALVRKYGGHPDQLSTAITALDRFRIVALARFLDRESDCPKWQRDLVTEEIRKKSKILAQGAAKRNRVDWARFFESLEVPLAPAEMEKCEAYCEIA